MKPDYFVDYKGGTVWLSWAGIIPGSVVLTQGTVEYKDYQEDGCLRDKSGAAHGTVLYYDGAFCSAEP